MISDRYSRESIRQALVSQREFRPFRAPLGKGYPDVLEPRQIDSELRARFLQEAETAVRSLPFAPLPATLYLAWSRTGQAEDYQGRYDDRRRTIGAIAIGAWMDGGGAFVDPLIDALWQVCEESSWVLPSINYGPAGGRPRALPDAFEPWVDIFASETAALLAWAVSLNEQALDAVEPRVRERVVREIRRRVVLPYLQRADYWWMGFERDPDVVINNWNPWCNSNLLSAALLTEPDDETRLQVVMRAITSLDHFLDGYTDDGGCNEGTMYWAGAAGCLYDAGIGYMADAVRLARSRRL